MRKLLTPAIVALSIGAIGSFMILGVRTAQRVAASAE